MIFSSMFFLWIFLPLTFVGYYVAGEKLKNVILLLVSLLFYTWGEPIYIALMLVSIAFNYVMALLIAKFENKRKILLVLDVAVNLLLLGYYKYFNFFVSSIGSLTGVEYSVAEIALPVGISFFTFQALSYVVDVYRRECEAEKNIMVVALYISFFPQLIAGPIVKYKDIAEQIKSRQTTIDGMAYGIRRFLYGLGKKVILSNMLAQTVDRIIELDISDVTGALAWIAAIFYTLQIYFDFSGYSDMAIGLGKMFGFDIKENFNYPYISKSIREFWRRWHISLSSWFKDYLYIPLGGNQKGTGRTYINLGIVFFMTGLWHGASWNFIIWGLYHGFFSVLERIGLDKLLKKSKIFAHIYTMLVVIVGWVFFRITDLSQAMMYVKRMLMPWLYTASNYAVRELVDVRVMVLAIIAVFGSGVIQQLFENSKIAARYKNSKLEIVYCAVLAVVCFSLLASNSYNPFIYFRF